MATVDALLTQRGGGIEATPRVCGGDPCIAGTRIPGWTLEQYRRLGASDFQIVDAYPSLTPPDLLNAWAYIADHPLEIERQIRLNEDE